MSSRVAQDTHTSSACKPDVSDDGGGGGNKNKAEGDVGIVVPDDSPANEPIDEKKDKTVTLKRRRNIIIGVIVAIILIIAIAVGAAVGTKQKSGSSTTSSSSSSSSAEITTTSINVDDLAMELRGLAPSATPLPVDVAAGIATKYCQHFETYYANVGPLRDENPSLQRNIDVVECSVTFAPHRTRYHHRLRLNRDLVDAGNTADESIAVLSYSQSLSVESSDELFLPVQHTLTAPTKSSTAKDVVSEAISQVLIDAGLQLEQVEVGDIILPASVSEPPLLPDTAQATVPLCALCPEGWSMPQSMENTKPLQGYASDITSTLDPYVQYEYILAVLAFEQSTCEELSYILTSEKLNQLLEDEDWADEVCDQLQSHLLGRCCSSAGFLPPDTDPTDPQPEDIETDSGPADGGTSTSPPEGQPPKPPDDTDPGVPLPDLEPIPILPEVEPIPPCLKGEQFCPNTNSCIKSDECCDSEYGLPQERCPYTGKCVLELHIDNEYYCPMCKEGEKRCREEHGPDRCIPRDECCIKRCTNGKCQTRDRCCIEDACPGTVVDHQQFWHCPNEHCGCDIWCFSWWRGDFCCCASRQPNFQYGFNTMDNPSCTDVIKRVEATESERSCEAAGYTTCKG